MRRPQNGKWVVVAALAAAIVAVDALAQLDDVELARCCERSANVIIHRDTFGVPHVYGETDADCIFGLIYARAEDEYERIERGLVGLTGRSAEAYGPDAALMDLLVRAFEIPRLARDEYGRTSDDVRILVDAAADGLNFFLHTHPGVEPALFTHFEP